MAVFWFSSKNDFFRCWFNKNSIHSVRSGPAEVLWTRPPKADERDFVRDPCQILIYIINGVHFHCNLLSIDMSKGYSEQQILETLFNSKARIKVLKFLFRNYPINIGMRDLAQRIQEPGEVVQKEIRNLEKIGLIKRI